MSNVTKWFLLIAAIVIFNSCKTVTTAPETATATIDGRVLNWQPTGPLYEPPLGGVTVTIEGTNFSTTTDDSGYYTFQGVPGGTYNVSFSKAGYGTVLWFSENVTGGGNAPVYWYKVAPIFPNNNNFSQETPVMFKVSNLLTTMRQVGFKDTNIIAWSIGESMFLIAQGDVTPDPSTAQYLDAMAVYTSHKSDVSNIPGHYSTFLTCDEWGVPWNYPVDTTVEQFSFAIPISNLTAAGFKSGDSIYVAAYGSPVQDQGDYYDPAIQQFVMSSLNQTHSLVIGTKMP